MALFAVISAEPNLELGQRIKAAYPSDHYELTPSQWLVSADTIPTSLKDQLDIGEGKSGRVIILSLAGAAAGWHSSTVWEWLRQKRTVPE